MKRIVFIVLGLAALTFSSDAYAQTNEELIERALLAAPARSSEGTGVIKWNADYTYETLKEGTNPLVCWDRSGDPGERAFATSLHQHGESP